MIRQLEFHCTAEPFGGHLFLTTFIGCVLLMFGCLIAERFSIPGCS